MIGSAVSNVASLTGSIKSDISLLGSLRPSFNLRGSAAIPVGRERYIGDYQITPMTTEQVMATNDKYMADDVVINPIPYYEVSNARGGVTIIIGGTNDVT